MPLPSHAASQQFWATSFFAFKWSQHGELAPSIISHLYGLRDQQKTNIASGVAPGAKSNAGLYESDFDLLQRGDHDGLSRLRAFIEESVKHAVSHVNNLAASTELDVEIADSWYHITNAGGFHDSHFHSHCSWCGIYYLQLGDAGRQTTGAAPNGGNRFYSPLWSGGQFQDVGNRYLGSVYLDPPISDGMLLLFPSYLMHSGLPYTGEKDRIVISVNTRTRLS